MSKRGTKAKRRASPAPNSWIGPHLYKKVFVLLVILGFASAGLAAYKHNHEVLHDLSVVGNGTPSVVQIHDPGCRLCQSLKSNSQSAMSKFDGELNYRIANIRTKPGRALARRHDVPHVTLLFFDGSGKMVRTTQGVLEADTLEHLFQAHVDKSRKSAGKAAG